jgi:hypothetical protein
MVHVHRAIKQRDTNLRTAAGLGPKVKDAWHGLITSSISLRERLSSTADQSRTVGNRQTGE